MFSIIYSTYSGKLYQYGLRFTSNRTLIEDSIQDLFFELIKNRKSIGHTDNILRYLLKSFRNKLFRLLKQQSRYDLRDNPDGYLFEVVYSIEHQMIIEEMADRKMRRFKKVLSELTPRQKEAIYLRFTNGLNYEEVAEIMEINLDSCRNLICRAVRCLREALLAERSNESL